MRYQSRARIRPNGSPKKIRQTEVKSGEVENCTRKCSEMPPVSVPNWASKGLAMDKMHIVGYISFPFCPFNVYSHKKDLSLVNTTQFLIYNDRRRIP